MTREDYDELMKLEKRDLIVKIWQLEGRVEKLEKQNSDMGWQLSPDRMGGSFSEWETNRRGDEWS